MDRWKVPVGSPQHVQQPLGRPEAPLDAAPLSREEKAAGVLEGQPAQSAASAGRRPAMCRSNWAVVSRSSLRGTTASTIPCSSRNSAVWNPGELDRKSTRLNSSHSQISYAVFCLKKKNKSIRIVMLNRLRMFQKNIRIMLWITALRR